MATAVHDLQYRPADRRLTPVHLLGTGPIGDPQWKSQTDLRLNHAHDHQ
jgi:hypothetical protein